MVWFAACLLLAGITLLHGQSSVTASLDRRIITVGETAGLWLSFSGEPPQTPPAIPRIPNLVIRYERAAEQVQIVNGQMTRTVNHGYSVTPTEPGEYTIPAIQIQIGAQTLTTVPLLLVVQKPDPNRNPTEAGEPFLGLIVPKTELHVGETMVAELHLYFRNVDRINLPQLRADGFTAGQISDSPARRQRQVDGVAYNVMEWQFPVTAAKAGPLAFGPAECNLDLLVPRPDRRGMFRQPVTLASESHIITARPLPSANVPPTFTGGIGQFEMNVTAGPSELAVGDPITLRVQISGRGSLNALRFPEQAAWNENFRTYPPTSRTQQGDALGLSGIRIFEQVVSPLRAGIQELPPFHFSYFDPQTGNYQTLVSPAVPLVVRSGSTASAPTIAAGNGPVENRAPPPELVHIKPSPGTIAAIRPPLIRQTWFWLAQGLGPLALAVAFALKKRREQFDRNPRLRREREVDRAIRKGLRELRAQADANQPETFFAAVFRLLQERIGERLDMPAAAITEAILDDSLRRRGLETEALALLHELFQTCNQARYAPHRTSRELNEFIPKVESALESLRKLPA